jgi:hypothetical protein
VTSVKMPGKPFRIVGTWDDQENLLFSMGSKNFKSKAECAACHKRKPMMHKFVIGRKGQSIEFADSQVFCDKTCFRRWKEHPSK